MALQQAVDNSLSRFASIPMLPFIQEHVPSRVFCPNLQTLSLDGVAEELGITAAEADAEDDSDFEDDAGALRTTEVQTSLCRCTESARVCTESNASRCFSELPLIKSGSGSWPCCLLSQCVLLTALFVLCR